MSAGGGALIDGVTCAVSPEAVVVQSRAPLAVVSSAVAGGGLATARSIVNLRVPENWQPVAHGTASGWEAALDAFVARRGLPTPYVGLCTSAWTEHAEVAGERGAGLDVMVLATVGLGNPVAAGLSARAAGRSPSTINVVAILEARALPAAMVNLVATVSEVKTAVLRDAAIRCPDGHLATGTSTDAVVIAATGRGRACEFGGPVSDLGALVARAARRALERGVAAWLERHR